MEHDKKCGSDGCKYIKNVHCDVHNCIHHDGDCYCTADSISVGPSFATASQETACVTFEQVKN